MRKTLAYRIQVFYRPSSPACCPMLVFVLKVHLLALIFHHFAPTHFDSQLFSRP
jgi:hypothetical protein